LTAGSVSVPSKQRARWPIFVGLAVVVLVADQLSKSWLVSFLAPGQRTEVVGPHVRLVHAQNTGALFGLFRDQAILFAFVSVGVVGMIIWFHGNAGRNTLLSIALGLLLGGALGNMADRFRYGYVVDFVDLGIGDLRWYTFNVADASISCAILLLLLSAILPEVRASRAPRSGAPASDAVPPGGGHGADHPERIDA
jgi:signal peptidase II